VFNFNLGSTTGTSSSVGATNGTITVGGTSTGIMITTLGETTMETPTGTKVQSRQGTRDLGPRLYFSYVKSKLTKLQVRDLKPRIERLAVLLEDVQATGQRALYEELMTLMALAIREQELSVAGYDQFVLKPDIERFRGHVVDRTVSFVPLADFGRPLPREVKAKLDHVKRLQLFDQFWVLANNPLKEAPKTMARRIQEKDPILFGRWLYDEHRYFYIADWIDEHCDLTLDKFVSTLSQKSQQLYTPGKLRPLTTRQLCDIKDEVFKRHEALAATRPNNFNSLARQEEDRTSRGMKRWWKFWK
jgi:hypothetical protein